MTKNIYFRDVYARTNVIRDFFYGVFLKASSYFRMLLEVFLRKNFGQRYFSLATAITIALFMLLWPIVGMKTAGVIDSFREGYSYGQPSAQWPKYIAWYAFTLGFIISAYARWREIKVNPSVFDFGKFSLYTGDINRWFYKLRINGKRPSIRAIETLYEPAIFLGIGIFMFVIGQALGMLLIITSMVYCISYLAAYKKGDDLIMDKIDEMIMNEEMERAFVEDLVAENTRGVRFYTRKPVSKSLRQKLADSLVETDGENDEKTVAT